MDRGWKKQYYFSARTNPFQDRRCTLRMENLWGSRASTRDPSTRDEFEARKAKRIARNCASAYRPRAPHTLARCEREMRGSITRVRSPEGVGFRPIVRPILRPLVLIRWYCQVALAKFVIVLDYGHFMRGTLKLVGEI